MTYDTSILNKWDLDKVSLLYPKVRDRFLHFLLECKSKKINGGFFMSYRTFEEQNNLYAQGRTKPGNIVTQAIGGMSYHNYGLACDFVFKVKNNWTWEGDYDRVGRIAKLNGLEWGGSWGKGKVDNPHLQVTFNQPIEKLLAIYKKSNTVIQGIKTIGQNGNLIRVWSYLDSLKIT